MKIAGSRTLVAVAAGLAAASGATAAAASLPKVPGEGPIGRGNPAFKPAQIIYTGDGSGFFAGTHKHGHSFGKLHWTRWNGSKADASGDNWLNDCSPNCAQGKFHGYPVKIELSRPGVVAGAHVFTRLKLTYTGKVPSHEKQKQTWKLGHSDKVLFWKFPA